MGDPVTGGSLYWLNDGIDRGDIAYQDWCFIAKEDTAQTLWRERIQPIALGLFGRALNDLLNGHVIRERQDNRFSTFEPGLDQVKDVYRPDLLMLGAGK